MQETLLNGRYSLIGVLGEGGQSTVYLAEDLLLARRRIALKILSPLVDAELFTAEFTRLTRLRHPGIVRVHDLEVAGDTPGAVIAPGSLFFSEEYIGGESLEERGKIEPWKVHPRGLVKILSKVALSLDHLHLAGIVHGDVKASNIIMRDDSQDPVLIDLGLSTEVSAGEFVPRGTLEIMAPEAIKGQRGYSSDIYSLGITAAKLLGAELLGPGMGARFSSSSQVPPELRAIVGRMTAARPEDRYTTGKRIAEALEDFAEESFLGGDVSFSPYAQRPKRSYRLHGRERELEDLVSHLVALSRSEDDERPLCVVVHGGLGYGRTRLSDEAVWRCQMEAAQRGEGGCLWLASTVSKLFDPGERGGADIRLNPPELEHGEGMVLRMDDQEGRVDPELLHRAVEDIRRGDLPVLGMIIETERADVALAANEMSRAATVRCGPLSREAVAAVLGELEGKPLDEEILEDAWKATGGIPALLEHWSLSSSRGGREGQTVGGIIDAREAAALSLRGAVNERQWAMVEAMAVAGEPLTLSELSSAVSGLEPGDMYRLSEVAAPVGEEFSVGLPLALSEGVRHVMAPRRRRTLHQWFLAVLDERGGGDSRRAFAHAFAGGDFERAKEEADRAYQDAVRVGDLRGAGEIMERVLELYGDSCPEKVLIRASESFRRIGEYSRARAVLESAAGGVNSDRLELERASVFRLMGERQSAREKLVPIVDSGGKPALAARALMVRIDLDAGDLKSASRELPDLDELSDEELTGTGILSAAGLTALYNGDPVEASRNFARGRRLEGSAEDPREASRLAALEGMVAHSLGQWEEAAGKYEEALEISLAGGDGHGAAAYTVNLAAALTEQGEYEAALKRYEEGIWRQELVGKPDDIMLARGNLAQLLLRLGDLGGARRVLSKVQDDSDYTVEGRGDALVRCVIGDLLIIEGHSESAIPHLLEAHTWLEEAGFAKERAVCERHLSFAYLDCGNLDEAGRWDELAQGHEEEGRGDLEGARFALGLRRKAGGDFARELEDLVSALPPEESLPGCLEPAGFADAARSAVDLGMTQEAVELSVIALEIFERRRSATPPGRRPLKDPVEEEMKLVLEKYAKRDVHAPSAESGWRRLARINTRLNSETRLSVLLDMIMDTALEVTGAQRGFLLVSGKEGDLRVRSARNMDRAGLEKGDQGYSRSVAERAFESGIPVVTTDAQEDPQFNAARSVVALDLRYIMAVPLQVQGVVTGTIYVDSRAGGDPGNQTLALLESLADQAAIAITNARLAKENRRRRRRIERLNKSLEQKLKTKEAVLARTVRDLEEKNRELARRYELSGIVGASEPMVELFGLMDRIVATDLPVVITGESGTGKELVAKAIHHNGARAKKPFVAENCAAIPPTIIESILFGHVRGAFTGAARDNRGLFVAANSGTLFLDEIGDLPLEMQAKLLRVLQEGEVRPVGGSKSIPVDVRILAATNKNLEELVDNKTFREDLFYRLNVVPVALPPLRDRLEDIPLLVDHFVEKHAPDRKVAPSTHAALQRRPWPGNVRQLENTIMRALVLTEGVLEPRHLPDQSSEPSAAPPNITDTLDMDTHVDSLKSTLIRTALKRSNGNRTKAAESLGISRYGLQKMMTRLGM